MPKPHRIAIVGAGMAGLACAEMLSSSGRDVHVFDKGRGPGGRMSARRVAINGIEVSFDHGAQYFTARDPAFMAAVKTWLKQGLVAPWPAAGPDAWVGAPAMNAPIANLAAGLQVQFSRRVDRIVRGNSGWQLKGDDIDAAPYDAVIVAVPAEQVAPLIIDNCPGFALSAKVTPSTPCWTLMAAFDQPLPVDADIFRSDGDIAWAARNSSKPGRAAIEAWVIQASADWSRKHTGASQADVIAGMRQAFERETARILPEPVFVQAHSWLYAKSGSNGYGYLWEKTIGLGVCGDWLVGPRIECAWLSGRALAKALIRSSKTQV